MTRGGGLFTNLGPSVIKEHMNILPDTVIYVFESEHLQRMSSLSVVLDEPMRLPFSQTRVDSRMCSRLMRIVIEDEFVVVLCLLLS